MSTRLSWRGMLDRVTRRRADHRAVQEFSRSLALIVDREALGASVAARIKELFDPDRLVILEPDPATASFVPSFSSGLHPANLDGVRVPARGRLARWLSVNERCLVLDRQEGVYEYLDRAEKDLLARLEVTVCAPLISLNRLTGILLLGSDRPRWCLSDRDAELLELLASQASLAFENAALYREQRERLDRLHRAERLAAVGQLAAGVAHEIRNPLTAIRSTMQYLAQGLDGDGKRELVGELLSEVDRINGTIGGLLSLSRTGELRLVEVDLAEPLGRALQLVRAHANGQGIVLEASPGSGAFRVVGDVGQLEQVFLNLLLNAVQAMPGGGRITVSVAPCRPHLAERVAPWVEVRIADTGPGIPPDHLRRVFDPFFTTKRDGTGLGLAICHGVVEQHRGEIRLESAKGVGTTALIRLPLLEEGHGQHPGG